MKHKALIRRLQISCLGLDPIDPLRLLVDDVIEALRENAMREVQRLGQEIEQEPVELCQYGQEPASCTSSPMDCQCAIDAALAQPEQDHIPDARKMVIEQEPVKYSDYEPDGVHHNKPPQRTWVGLTDEDKHEIELRAGITEDDDGYIVSQVFKLTEAKLKEKNNA